jgi:hypothetical protein
MLFVNCVTSSLARLIRFCKWGLCVVPRFALRALVILRCRRANCTHWVILILYYFRDQLGLSLNLRVSKHFLNFNKISEWQYKW